ncbi:hypothetical protein TrVGV298_002283 [Trichoderma virens]|nr:hypothetical protein TrVGV298_002283 [Trichoderma virens]
MLADELTQRLQLADNFLVWSTVKEKLAQSDTSNRPNAIDIFTRWRFFGFNQNGRPAYVWDTSASSAAEEQQSSKKANDEAGSSTADCDSGRGT